MDEEEEVWGRVPEGDGEWCVATQDHQIFVSADFIDGGVGEPLQGFEGAAMFDERTMAEVVCDVSQKHFKMPHRYRFIVVPEVEIRQERLDRGFLRKISRVLYLSDLDMLDEMSDQDDSDFIY